MNMDLGQVKQETNIIQPTEMRYFRKVKGCSRLDYIKNNVGKKQKKKDEYRQNWINQLGRMTDERILKCILQIQSKRCQNQGRLWKYEMNM
jgi:hypothetical protein